MPNSSEKYSFLSSYVHGEMLSGGFNVATKALAGVNAFIVISHLEVFKYGVYVLLLSYVALMIGLFVKPFADVVQNDIARFIGAGQEAEAKRLFWENTIIRIGIACLLTLGTFLGADLIARFYGQDVAVLIRILSPIFLVDVLTTTLRTFFELRLRFGEPALRATIYNGSKLLLLIGALIFFTIDILEVLVIYLLSSLISLLVFLPQLWKLYQPWRAVRAARAVQILPIMLGHGKWRALSQALSSGSSSIRPWLIKFFVNTEAVAIYSVAESLFGALKTLIPGNTFVTLIPREVGQDKLRAVRILVRGTKFLVAAGIVLAALGLLLVPPVVLLIIPHYTPSLPLFALLLIELPILGISTIASYYLFALQKQRYMFLVNLARIPLSWIMPVILLYFFGLFGMPFERILISLFVTTMYFGFLLRHEVPRELLALLISFDATDRELLKRAYRELAATLRHRLSRLLPLSH